MIYKQLYTSSENVIANEYDFKKALDLLDYVEQEEDKLSLRLLIWARAARRNQWNTVEKNPEQQVQETLFFKLMDLVYFMGKLYVIRYCVCVRNNTNLCVFAM